MDRRMRWAWAAAWVFALGCGTATAETLVKFYPHTGVIEEVNPAAKALTDFGAPTDTLLANNITFRLFIEDIRLDTNLGFDGPSGAAAIARTKEALAYIASVLNVPAARTLDILFDVSESDGTGFLASAGSFFSASNGFFNGSAFTRLTTNTKPFADFEEIGVTVDFGHTWNFGTGAPNGSQIDFLSVITHELTHGLGIASLATANGNSAFFNQFGTQTFTSWDNLLTRGDGGTRIWSNGTPQINNLADLTSNNVFFNGAQARARYNQGGDAPGVFAPATFLQGSSIGHLDTGNIVGGAMMEHAIAAGVQFRNYSPAEIGALIDLGYTNAADPGEGEGEGEGAVFCDVASVNITAPVANINLGPGVTNTVVNFTSDVFVFDIPGCLDGTVRVTYKNGGTTLGSSTNPLNGFLVAANLATGNYTIVATAELLDTGTTVTDQQSFSIVSGQANPEIQVSPSPASGFNFGEVSEAAVRDQSFVVENVGGGTLTGQASVAGGGYAIVGNGSYNLGSGQTATIIVRFVPTGPGSFQGVLSFSGDPNGALQIALSGTGLKTGFFGCGVDTAGADAGASRGDGIAVALMAAFILLAAIPMRRRTLQ